MTTEVRVQLYCPSCGHRWSVDKQQPTAWCPKCNATPPILVEKESK